MGTPPTEADKQLSKQSSSAAPVTDDRDAEGNPPPYHQTPEALATRFDVDAESGLADAAAKDRLTRYGSNQLEEGGGVSWVSVLAAQICTYSFCTWMLGGGGLTCDGSGQLTLWCLS